MNFKNKTVIITGASSGIGKGLAIAFSKLEANLVIGGRDVDNLNNVKLECIRSGLTESQVICILGDITNDTVWKLYVNGALENFNRIDILVNNAGIAKTIPLSVLTMEDFDLFHKTNLRPAVGLSLLTLPYLKITKGTIVNISSVSATRPLEGSLVYSISKSQLDAFSKCLALEAAEHGVRINSVGPGAINTNIDRNSPRGDPKIKQALLNAHPFGRFGEIDEVVEAVLYLVSDKANFVTGQVLQVDGGRGISGL